MLLVNPMKRITIPEIRQHPWFTTHLPRYLAVMQVHIKILVLFYTFNYNFKADTIMTASRLDNEVLDVIEKEGIDRKSLVEWLKKRAQNEVCKLKI